MVRNLYLHYHKGPVLLGLEPESDEVVVDRNVSSSPVDDDGLWKEMPRHRDEDQVQLDVNRAFIYYPNSMLISRPKYS